MGTSDPAMLRHLAAARAATSQADALEQILLESRRAADNSQVIVDQLTGPPEN